MKVNLLTKYIKLEQLKWFESSDSRDQIQIDPFSTFGNNLCMTLTLQMLLWTKNPLSGTIMIQNQLAN